MAYESLDGQEGLTIHTVAEPTADTERSFDIIALHGIGGVWDETWTSDADDKCWLRDVLPVKFPSSRILSLDCPSLLRRLGRGNGDVSDIISELVRHRDTTGRTHRPIVFIGHSLGGNLLKQIFVTTHPSRESWLRHQYLHESIRGFLFLGTPHKPVVFERFDFLLGALERGGESLAWGRPSDLEQAFEVTSRINHDFRRLGGEDLPAVCFYEGATTMVAFKETFIVPREKVLFLLRPVNSFQVDLPHQRLCKLGDMSDVNARHVVSHLEDLFGIIESPDFGRRLPTAPATRRGINILSLDGGGVKGLFSLIVLERILAEVQRLDGSSESKRLPCDYFDLIGGTSTGGLLAIMLGRLQMDIPSCIDTYRSMSASIFSRVTDGIPWLNKFRNAVNLALGNALFDGDPLEEAICRTVMQHITTQERDNLHAANLSARDVRLVPTEVSKTASFVCAVCEDHHKPERIRSYLPRNRSHHQHRDTSSYTIWQAARATSAAPVYFPPIEIQGHHYFDGGLAVNNPLLEVIEEAQDQFPNIEIDAIVSIGTGKGPVITPVPPITNIAFAIVGRLTDTEAQYEQFMEEERFEALRPVCSRFQETDNRLGKIDLAAADKLGEIETIAREYVALPEVKRELTACAARMIRSRPWKT